MNDRDMVSLGVGTTVVGQLLVTVCKRGFLNEAQMVEIEY